MPRSGRRDLLSKIAGLAGGAAVVGTAAALTLDDAQAAEDVAPSEDLMREHGVHRRIILVYREAARRLRAGEPAPADALAESASLAQQFIHGYHEKLEEKHVLPRLREAGKLLPLIATIETQHAAGRILTSRIAPSIGDRARLLETLDAFVRMYEPHAQREDTELIPAYRAMLTPTDLRRLAERFEEEEHLALGDDGFEGALLTVRHIEDAFGLGDLARFTPRLT